jgi:hypothetical protein
VATPFSLATRRVQALRVSFDVSQVSNCISRPSQPASSVTPELNVSSPLTDYAHNLSTRCAGLFVGTGLKTCWLFEDIQECSRAIDSVALPFPYLLDDTRPF